jgi:hypothetical protein
LYNPGDGMYKGLIEIHPRVLGNEVMQSDGAPKYFALHNHALYVWPTPTAAMVTAGATIEILYSQVTNDITEIADEYQHVPLLYAAAMCKYKDHKFAEANSFLSIYNSFVQFERQDKYVRSENAMEEFKIPKQGGARGPARS